MKICLVSSSGGHFYQVWQLKPWWSKYDHFFAAPKKNDVSSLVSKKKLYPLFFPEHRNIFNFFLNLFLAIKILLKEKPDIIFSAGAGVAPPFFIIGKILRKKLIFMETYDLIYFPTLSGRIIYKLKLFDKFLIQHQRQKKFYPQAEYWGKSL